jgi:hypothetical protein
VAQGVESGIPMVESRNVITRFAVSSNPALASTGLLLELHPAIPDRTPNAMAAKKTLQTLRFIMTALFLFVCFYKKILSLFYLLYGFPDQNKAFYNV